MREYVASEYLTSPGKRAFDLVCATGLGSVALLGGGVAATASFAANGENPFFKQQRLGKLRLPFTVIKLKTMNDDGELLKGGAFMREKGLDETPQFINVLRGQMSVVGYRPVLAEDLNHAAQRLKAHVPASSPSHPNRWLSLREQCRPGITGPSQTMKIRPDAGTIDHLMDVVQAECDYMEQATMVTDIKLVGATFPVLQHGHNRTIPRLT